MAKVVYKSAGVTADFAGTITVPFSTLASTPALVIGTSQKGPAFSPSDLSSEKEFIDRFGLPHITGSSITPDDRYTTYAPLAIQEWLENSTAATFVRVLGVGDGKKRVQSGATTGDVTNAGFTVGEEQPNKSLSGSLGQNPYANLNGELGRTYFLGCFMSESQGSTIFSSAKIQGTGSINGIVNQAVPIIRGILMAPSGVILRLSSSGGGYDSSAPSSTLVGNDTNAKGTTLGSVTLFDPNNNKQLQQEFVLLLNGHKGTDDYPNVITASFDITSPNYISKVFNVTSSLIQQAGHYLAAHWDIHPVTAILTGTGVVTAGADLADDSNRVFSTERSAFIITSSLSRNVGSSIVPNYENFRDRFSNASSPWIISQNFQGKFINLFKLHAIDSGADVANKYKFIVSNITPAEKDSKYPYGTFDLSIRKITDAYDIQTKPDEEFINLSLDPSSPRYISKAIGDKNKYFDFDRVESEQRLVVEGNYDNLSRYVRVEVSKDVEDKKIPVSTLPMGFRGMSHLVTSGSSPLAQLGGADSSALIIPNFLANSITPPIPLADNIRILNDGIPEASNYRHWGIKLDHITSLTQQNLKTAIFNNSIDSFVKHFPNHSINNVNFYANETVGIADTTQLGIIDTDRFNNNLFTLENIKVVTGSAGSDEPNDLISDNWAFAKYVRDGVIGINDYEKTRRLKIKDFYDNSNRRYLSFEFLLQGGFDGVNIFDKDEYNISNLAVTADVINSNRGKLSGPNVSSYLSALKVVGSPTTVDMQLLAIPGIREPIVTNAASELAEERFDTLYLMDIEQLNDNEDLIEISFSQAYDDTFKPNTDLTANRFSSRSPISTFAAAYFPDVVLKIKDQYLNVYKVDSVSVPPSVAVLGAYSLNDRIGQPWFAPAGVSRGALKRVNSAQASLDEQQRNLLYSGSINPIFAAGNTAGEAAGVIIWGQKTLGNKNSILSRVSVRRLLLQIRRQVRDIAASALFESDRTQVIRTLESRITKSLDAIQFQSGLTEYSIDVNATMTSMNDIENGIVRVKIFIRPLGSEEFASVDVTVGVGGNSES